MLTRLLRDFTSLIRTKANRPSVVLFFAGIFVVSQLSISAVVGPVGIGHVLQLQTTLSVDEFTLLVNNMYQRGVESAYVGHYYYDFLHPIWYGGLLALLMGRGFNRQAIPASRNLWLLLPLVAGLADVVENGMHLYMVIDTANIAAGLVLLGNGAALCKWALIALCITWTLAMFVRPAAAGRSIPPT